MRVRVGTRNPLKVEATRAAFRAAFPGEPVEVIPAAVNSGVPAQPFGEEVLTGAIRRAKSALADADFGVGIEAGLIQLPGGTRYLNLQVCAIVAWDGKMSFGSSPGFELPPEVLEHLQRGSTLNREMSRIAGIDEIKEKIGAIGYLAKGRIDRFKVTYEAVFMALIPYIRPELFHR